MVTVVVDNQDALRLAPYIDPPFHATELGQPGGDPFERQPELQADRDGGQRVLKVVTTRYAQRDGTEAFRTAIRGAPGHGRTAVERTEHDTGRRDVRIRVQTVCRDAPCHAWDHHSQVRIVHARDNSPVKGHFVGEVDE